MFTNLDDRTPERLADLGLDSDASYLFVQVLSYANRRISDGHVPRGALHRFVSADPDRAAVELVAARVLVEVEDGWQVVGYSVPFDEGGWGQQSAETVRNKRAKSAASSERHRRHDRGDHSLCERCSVVRSRDRAVTGHSTGTEASVMPPNPTLSSPTPREEREREWERRDAAGRPLAAGAAPAAAAPRRKGHVDELVAEQLRQFEQLHDIDRMLDDDSASGVGS